MIHLHLALAATLAAPLSADSLVFSGREHELDVDIPRVEDAGVQVDARLDEPVWSRAAVLTGFTQYEPVEGMPTPFPTEVLVFYGPDAIYFGVRAYDEDPSGIQARMGQRDRSVFSDDWIRLMLDTFDDRRQAYVFYVNPLGIQTDGLWIEGLERRSGSGGSGGGVSIDFNPDFIWESDGRVTDEGWVAEIRIPYLSLRFRDVPVQDWGFNVAREVRRTGFKQSWAPLTQDVPSTLAQGGRFRGLRGMEPRRLVEINPVATGRRTGELVDGQFERGSLESDFGVNARLGVTRNLTLDATVNPDFSQVEADANRLTVNERFAIFFPEKRPFFLEGSEIFRMPANLVHTRRIVDPSVGAKMTGKVGAFQVGYLGAVDESPAALESGDADAVFNILRVRRDVGSGSTLGLVYTDRTRSSDDFNRVIGGDARFLLGRYTLTAQLAGSWTEAPDAAGSASFQPLVRAEVARSGRTFGWNVRMDDVSPDFRTRSGFVNRVGDTQLFGSLRYTRFGDPGALLEQANVQLRVDNYFDHDAFWEGARPFEHEVELAPSLGFRGDRNLSFVLRNGYFRFREEEYAGYGVEDPDGGEADFVVPDPLRNMLAVAVMPRVRVSEGLNVNGRVFLREIPIFLEAARGREVQVAPEVQLRPTHALSVSLSHAFSKIDRDRDGSTYSTAQISSVNAQYQFSRALSARALVQYDLEDRSALRDPRTERPILIGGEPVDASESGEFQTQLLLQYEPSPGTIFYVGYSRLEEGDRTYRPSGLDPVEDGLFLKLSYLFRI